MVFYELCYISVRNWSGKEDFIKVIDKYLDGRSMNKDEIKTICGLLQERLEELVSDNKSIDDYLKDISNSLKTSNLGEKRKKELRISRDNLIKDFNENFKYIRTIQLFFSENNYKMETSDEKI